MIKKKKEFNKALLVIMSIFIVFGLLIFFSSAMSVFTENRSLFFSLAINQVLLGVGLGSLLAYIAFRVDIKFFAKIAPWFFLFAVILMFLVFFPSLSMRHGGATRWLHLGPISFQPAEFLKLAVVFVTAWWFGYLKKDAKVIKTGFLFVAIILVLVGGLLLSQPDTGTFLVIIFAVFVIYYLAGAKWKHLALLVLFAIVGFSMIIAIRPYLFERIKTYIHPSVDTLGSGWQISQSAISIGSGGFFGRGYGKSVQKYKYLPEPLGDSIYAVVGEELGFVGSVFLIILYLAFLLVGFHTSRKTKSDFGRLLGVGIVSIVVFQSFLNIGASLAVFPLTGLPLIFISHGGTAMMISLLSIGILFSIASDSK